MKTTVLKNIFAILCLLFLSSAVNPKLANADFRFVAWGDTKDGFPALQPLAPKVVAQNPVFTIFAGDLELNGFTTTGMNVWKNAINGGTGNGLFDKTLSIRGNHDISHLTGWQGYYNFPAVAASVGATNFSTYTEDVTYSFDYDNSHFVALDVPGDVSLMTAEQISWLDSDLSAANSRGLVHAFIWVHGPPYCVSSSHCAYSTISGDAAPASFWTNLNKYPFLTAIFAGHEHLQAHTVLDSTRVPSLTRTVHQFVVGAAGAASVDPAPCDYSNRTSWCDTFDGYTVIDVSGDTVTVKFFDGVSSDPSQTFIIWTVSQYTVSASAGDGGSISPASRLVSDGTTTTFTVTPNTGYTTVMNGTCGGMLAGSTYTTNPITSNCTILATFILFTQPVPDGDLDGGGVSVTDALLALRITAGLITPTVSDIVHADVAPFVNNVPHPDGKIDIGDVVVILRKAIGLTMW